MADISDKLQSLEGLRIMRSSEATMDNFLAEGSDEGNIILSNPEPICPSLKKKVTEALSYGYDFLRGLVSSVHTKGNKGMYEEDNIHYNLAELKAQSYQLELMNYVKEFFGKKPRY